MCTARWHDSPCLLASSLARAVYSGAKDSSSPKPSPPPTHAFQPTISTMEMLCGQINVCMTVTPNNSLASFNSLRSVLSLQPRSHGYMATDRWLSLFLTALPIVCQKTKCWALAIRRRRVIHGGWVTIGQSGMRFKPGRTLGGNERSTESWHCRGTAQFSGRWGRKAPGNCGSCSLFYQTYMIRLCILVTWCVFLLNVTWLCGSGDTVILDFLLKQWFSSSIVNSTHGYLVSF